jgi:hypothetical protein
MSMLETALSTVIGFVVALLTQIFVFPYFGFHPHIEQNLAITLIFTVVSIVRQFVLRRLFEALHIRAPLSPSLLAIAAERRRQVEVEGWTPEHDDDHQTGELALAGACYAATVDSRRKGGAVLTGRAPASWPWSVHWWKPVDNRRDLVRAGALIVAELDKADWERKRKARAV